MDGQVVRQSSSYRQGLVLGLTMAEVMILLIFCLLIALAAVLRTEMAKLADAKAAPTEQGVSQNDREVLREVKKNSALYDRMLAASTSSNSKQADEFWRDLELYEKLQPGGPGRMTRTARSAASGPFVDRVAFLLDASLIDQARRSASKFQGELEDAADRVLRNVLSQRRAD